MIDLDRLAENRAVALKEGVEHWRTAVWSPLFQKLTQNMSDGEIEQLLGACPSHAHFESVLRFLQPAERQAEPMAALTAEAAKNGQDMAGWIRSLV